MAFTYRDMGHAFHKHILRIFRNGWTDCTIEMLFMLLFAYIAV